MDRRTLLTSLRLPAHQVARAERIAEREAARAGSIAAPSRSDVLRAAIAAGLDELEARHAPAQ